jgi:hypothetical protein
MARRGGDVRLMMASYPGGSCIATDKIGRHYVLADGAFLHAYGAGVTGKIVDDPVDCFSAPESSGIGTIRNLTVTNWGRALPLMRVYNEARKSANVLQIEGGKVSPSTHANTPTGRGAFGNSVDTPLGEVGDFTVLSGYEYMPTCMSVEPGSRLTFAVSTLVGSAATAFQVRDSGEPHGDLIEATVPASSRRDTPTWYHYSVPVPPSACATISFYVKRAPNVSNCMTFAGASIR